MLTGSLNLTDIVYLQTKTIYNIIPFFPIAIMLFIAILAETNRAPFDLPEAEAEIVAGYNLEYSGILFAMFFLGEYGNMIIMSSIVVLFFFGG
jgi:NADH-quinone oxidoreductase subunit H